jgi:hypothetical protein
VAAGEGGKGTLASSEGEKPKSFFCQNKNKQKIENNKKGTDVD